MTMHSHAALPLLAFVGRSGSGKTTLLTRLIPRLNEQGVRVAIIKHSPIHSVETDVPGSDTRRLWEAGAAHVSLVAHDRAVHTHRYAAEPEFETVLAGVSGADLVLLEGYKWRDVDKIEVIRRARDPVPIRELARRIACVTDVASLTLPCPIFGLDDVPALADFVIEWLGCRCGRG
jgi:molybdopterin-guanine dinucleotide biosynthesis adapter protein